MDDVTRRRIESFDRCEHVFAADTAALASWKSASHVENPPKKKKKDDDGGDPPPTP